MCDLAHEVFLGHPVCSPIIKMKGLITKNLNLR